MDFICLLPAAIRLGRSARQDIEGDTINEALAFLEQFWKEVRQGEADVSAQVEAGYAATYQAAVDLLHDSRLATKRDLRTTLLTRALTMFVEMANNATDPLRQLLAKGSVVTCYHALKEPALAQKWDNECKAFATRLAKDLRTELAHVSRPRYVDRYCWGEDDRNPVISTFAVTFDAAIMTWDFLSNGQERHQKRLSRLRLRVQEVEELAK